MFGWKLWLENMAEEKKREEGMILVVKWLGDSYFEENGKKKLEKKFQEFGPISVRISGEQRCFFFFSFSLFFLCFCSFFTFREKRGDY